MKVDVVRSVLMIRLMKRNEIVFLFMGRGVEGERLV